MSEVQVCYAADASVWMDVNGRNCEQYVSLGFCKSGSFGPNWREDEDGFFSDYADEDGMDLTLRIVVVSVFLQYLIVSSYCSVP